MCLNTAAAVSFMKQRDMGGGELRKQCLCIIVRNCAVGKAALARIIRLGLFYRIDSWYEFRANPPSSSATLGRGEEGKGRASLDLLMESIVVSFEYINTVAKRA